jgi:transposase InsO family protein
VKQYTPVERRSVHSAKATAVFQWGPSRRAEQLRAGLVHHSDRGTQYASNDYAGQGIIISMSRKGNPRHNAACKSFMKTLKYEEVLRNEYGT